jgi:hypothetical protein
MLLSKVVDWAYHEKNMIGRLWSPVLVSSALHQVGMLQQQYWCAGGFLNRNFSKSVALRWILFLLVPNILWTSLRTTFHGYKPSWTRFLLWQTFQELRRWLDEGLIKSVVLFMSVVSCRLSETARLRMNEHHQGSELMVACGTLLTRYLITLAQILEMKQHTCEWGRRNQKPVLLPGLQGSKVCSGWPRLLSNGPV